MAKNAKSIYKIGKSKKLIKENMSKIEINKLQYENEYLAKGAKLIGGVDEVGRGPLAGPVVCACCVMPMDNIIEGVDDSKKLSEKKRNILSEKIKEIAIDYKIALLDEKVIDKINILNATKQCMVDAINGLKVAPDIVLIDAVQIKANFPTFSIIKGDLNSYSIACASILAKVERDRMMVEYSKIYPEYGFEQNKGYGTKTHIEQIKKIGICEIHRHSFVKNFV
ncbi:MAG: ribonuclease HII [Clostridia bacterium]